jgi:HPt (histidine-containing phosphotransfer) domain-containing protein
MEPIRSIYEDDPDMLAIVEEFVSELPTRIEELLARLDEGQLDQLQTLAHQLKGAGGGYGLPQITECAASLEQSLKDSRSESTIKERCRALCELLAAVKVGA